MFLHVDLFDADLDLGVELDGATGLQGQLVHAPVDEVVAGHDGADGRVHVQAAAPVRVQDGAEPGPTLVEEHFVGDKIVVVTATMASFISGI